MAGLIVGFYGYQRSGKTLLATIIAERMRTLGSKVYTNMDVDGFIKIKSLTDLPKGYEPKVLLLDEAYYFLDSRDWSNNTKSSIFFNTLGKRNILLLFTAISPDMIDKRIRGQTNYMFVSKGDKKKITYKVIDIIRQKSKCFSVLKDDKLFGLVKYDTTQVPDFVDCSLENFNK